MVREAPRRAAVFLLAGMTLASVPAIAEISAGDLTLTVTPELNGNANPYSREMVLLRIRGVYRQPILLEEVIQPSLANFSWTQLGRDQWSKTRMADGQTAIAFERVVAVFPHRSGDFTIDPFIHRLTVNDGGARVVFDARSAPVRLPVAPWGKPIGGPDAKEPWWLPAKDVVITDSWSPDPETIKIGESARRIVTIEAQGLVAEGLPPRPVLRTRGILTFAGPITRETIITPSGPIARATYQWDVKPAIAEIIPLNAIVIPWFDTVSRTMREAEIPARQIGGGLPDREDDAKPIAPASSLSIVMAGVAAFGFGLLLLGFGAKRRRTLRLDRSRRHELVAAAESNDAMAFRATLEGAAPELIHAWRDAPDVAAALTTLDEAVYARSGGSLDLRELARILSKPVTIAATKQNDATPLANLDGRTSATIIGGR